MDRLQASPPALTLADGDFRALVESFVDPLFVLGQGAFAWVAPSIEAVLGWTDGDLTGSRLVDLAHPEDSPSLDALVMRASAGQSAREVVRLRHARGDFAWILVTLSPWPAHPTHAAGVLREIDRRYQVEQRMRLLAAHASDIVLTVGLDRRISWVSPSVVRMLGWQPVQLVASVLADLVHPADGRMLAGRFDAESGSVVVRIRTQSGAYRWMRVSSEDVIDARQGVIGQVVCLQDVDELVTTRERIQQDAEQVRSILDAMLDPYALLVPRRDTAARVVDFQVLDINVQAQRFWSVSRGQIVGAQLHDLVPAMDESNLVAALASAFEKHEPAVLDDVVVRDGRGDPRRVDVRAVRIDGHLSLIWRDVTEERRSIEALAASEEQYRLLAENATDVILRYADDGSIAWASPSLSEALGWTPEEWVGRNITDFVHIDDMDQVRQDWDRIEAGSTVASRGRLRAKDLSYHWVEVHANRFIDSSGEPHGIVVSFRVIDAEVEAEAALDRRARYDELTGLLSRREVLERVTSLTADHRQPGRQTAVLFCDLDRFKEVNDAHGHAAGDQVLRVVAARLGECIRHGDLAARVGGDELIAVLDRVHGLEDALRVAEKVRAAVGVAIPLNSHSVVTSVSIGVTMAHAGEDVDALIARADSAMYQAKRNGRNQIIAIDDDPRE